MSFQQDYGLGGLSDFSEGEIHRILGEDNAGTTVLSPLHTDSWSVTAGTVEQTSTHVSTKPFPGELNFHAAMEEPFSRSTYTFSAKLNRLYIDWNKAVPIKFSWDGPSLHHIRAMLVFKDPDYEKNAVMRCRIHADPANHCNKDYEHVNHVLRCDQEKSSYVTNEESKRHSIVTIQDNISEWTGSVTFNYRFMCKTSCVGGLNRNKTDIIFTLEDSNCHVVGRAVMGVKICSCPRRDKEKDEAPGSGKRRRTEPTQHFMPQTVKQENCQNTAFVDYRVRVPEGRAVEFEQMLRRWLYASEIPPEMLFEATAGSLSRIM